MPCISFTYILVIGCSFRSTTTVPRIYFSYTLDSFEDCFDTPKTSSSQSCLLCCLHNKIIEILKIYKSSIIINYDDAIHERKESLIILGWIYTWNLTSLSLHMVFVKVLKFFSKCELLCIINQSKAIQILTITKISCLFWHKFFWYCY